VKGMNSKMEETNALLRAVLKLQKDWGRFDALHVHNANALATTTLLDHQTFYVGTLCTMLSELCWYVWTCVVEQFELVWWNQKLCVMFEPSNNVLWAGMYVMCMMSSLNCVCLMSCDDNVVDDGFWYIFLDHGF
jgi:hypothetical protein